MMSENTKTYIIGLGTGRCGTKSLATLLNGCVNADISHEFRKRNVNHRLPWHFKGKYFDKRIQDLKQIKASFVGDVASYYLSYIEDFYKNLSNLKVIYLYRDIASVTNSFINITKIQEDGTERNHWLSHRHAKFKDGRFKKMKWDRCFPKYRKYNTKRMLIQRYCKEYAKKIKKLKQKYPKLIFSVDINILNELPIQKAIYDFLEMPEGFRNYKAVIENKGVK